MDKSGVRELSRVAEPPRDLQDTVLSWVPACFHDDASDAPTASHQDLGREEQSRSGTRVVVHSSSCSFNSLVFKYGSQAELEVFSWHAFGQHSPGPHNGVGPRGKGKSVGEGFVNDAEGAHAGGASPSSSVEITATKSTLSSNITVRNGQQFLADATLFGAIVVDVQRQDCEGFWAADHPT